MATIEQGVAGFDAYDTSLTISLSAVGNGNAIIVVAAVYSSNTVDSCTDNGGASPTYDEDHDNVSWSGADPGVCFFKRMNVTDSPTSVTISTGSDGTIWGWAFEVSGLDSSPLDDFDDNSGSGTTASASIISTVDNAVAIGFVGTGFVTTSFTGDYTEIETSEGDGEPSALAYDGDIGTAGSDSISCTLGSSYDWGVLLQAYKPEAAAAGLPSFRAMNRAMWRGASRGAG